MTIREDALLDMLADMLQDALDTALGQYTLSLAELPQQAADRAELREKITSRKQEIQWLRGIVRSLYENLVQGVLTKDEYFDYKEKYESRIADLAVEMEQLEDGLRTMDTQIEQHRALEQDAAQIKTDRTLTGVLIDRLIDRIEVSHDKQITVRYRFQSEFETGKHEAPAVIGRCFAPSIMVMTDFSKNRLMTGQSCFKKQEDRKSVV